MKLILPILASTLMLSSCALLTKSKDERTYYAFRSTSISPIGNYSSLNAHIRSVSIPGYLDRTELVSRTTANEVDVFDRYLWAESLDKEIANNVATSLRHLLGSSQIVALDSELATRGDGSKVDIEVTRFELDQNGSVLFEGLYRISKGSTLDATAGNNQAFTFTAPVAGAVNKNAAIVAAMNTCLDELSLDIARALAKRG